MSAAVIRTVTTKSGEFKYDSDMPIGALKALLSAASESDITKVIEALALFITEWPFEGDPANPEAWDAIRRSEFNALVTGIMEDLGKLGEK